MSATPASAAAAPDAGLVPPPPGPAKVRSGHACRDQRAAVFASLLALPAALPRAEKAAARPGAASPAPRGRGKAGSDNPAGPPALPCLQALPFPVVVGLPLPPAPDPSLPAAAGPAPEPGAPAAPAHGAAATGAAGPEPAAAGAEPAKTTAATAGNAGPAGPAAAPAPATPDAAPAEALVVSPAQPGVGSAPPAPRLTAPAAEPPARAAGVTPAAQIADAVALKLAPDGGKITIQLHPGTLGAVEIRLERPHGAPPVVTLAVEKPETLHALQQDLPRLHQALDRAGIAPDAPVTLQLSPAPGAHTAGSGLGQPGGGHSSPQQHPAPRHAPSGRGLESEPETAEPAFLPLSVNITA